jgi:4-aminobutyrate aminotransferase
LLIADEVQSGIGRTGKMFAVEHWEVEPDIIASAKGLGSGLPIGAVIARKSLMKEWMRGAHGNTFGGNPLSCAAALASLELVENGYMANAATIGNYLLERLKDWMERYPVIGDVRGKGLMIGLEFVEDRESKLPAKAFANDVIQEAFRCGLLLLPCGLSTIRLMPPLMLPRELADEGLDILEGAIRRVYERLG